MGHRAKPQLYPLARAKSFKLFVIELCAIIGDDGSRDAETSNDVIPYKSFDLLLGNGCQRLGLHPFGQVIHSEDEEFSLSRCWWEWAEEVHLPLCEGPCVVWGVSGTTG